MHEQEKEKAIPKKKFSFARKKPAAKQESKPEPVPTPQDETKQAFSLDYSGNHLLIKDIQNERVSKTESEYAGKENLILENMKDCTIILPFAVKSIYMKHIENCKIYVGANSGATFVDSLINSKVFI